MDGNFMPDIYKDSEDLADLEIELNHPDEPSE